MDKNKKILNSIGMDIRMWKEGRPTPGEGLTYGAALLMSICNAAIWIHLNLSWWITCFCIIGGLIILTILSMCIFAKLPKNWPGVLDIKLTKYKPNDATAWRLLHDSILEKNTLSLEAVERWYLDEKAFGSNLGAPDYKFLKNK